MSERREHSRNFIRMTGLYPQRNPFILRTHEILMRHRGRPRASIEPDWARRAPANTQQPTTTASTFVDSWIIDPENESACSRHSLSSVNCVCKKLFEFKIRNARQTASPADSSSGACSYRNSELLWSYCFRWRWKNSGR